jgi:hypothetical protein
VGLNAKIFVIVSKEPLLEHAFDEVYLGEYLQERIAWDDFGGCLRLRKIWAAVATGNEWENQEPMRFHGFID